MKILVISTIAIALAGGTWTWVAPTANQPNTNAQADQDNDERIGVRRMLTNRADFRFVNLVVGTDHEGLRAFRARVTEDSHARPVFGQARRTCDSAPDLAECWEIATLQIDGQMRDFDQKKAETEAAPPTAAHTTTAEEEIETGDIPTNAVPRVITEFPASAAPNPAKNETVSDVTHLVARPIINARSGPGLSNEVLFKLTQGDRLILISEEEGWGRFVLLDGKDKGVEVWAALNILEDLR